MAKNKKTLSDLSPLPLWAFFGEILQIPRPSRKEDKMISFLLEFASIHHLAAKRDDAGNVLISKPACPGRENAPKVVLQTHMDMVCEKNSDKEFDFMKDPIDAIVGKEWVSADGTTLGADDGIGIAAQLALLVAEDIKHGPVECLFTVDEETGLTGAKALNPGFFSGRILINLDSEDEGEIFIGCAGGVDTVATYNYKERPAPAGNIALQLKVSGLLGGHSGDDIHKGRGNAVKIMVRFLKEALALYSVSLADFRGGNLRNAIAREAEATLLIPNGEKEKFLADYRRFSSMVNSEYENTEPELKMSTKRVPSPSAVVDHRFFARLMDSLLACPHGVIEWSSRMPGMVETSTNLASVKFLSGNRVEVTTSQRSEIESRKIMVASMVESVFRLGGAKIAHSEGYPGWAPDPGSPLLKVATGSYQKLFGTVPVVRSIHAGLECGLFLEKNPGLDMISIGPTIKGAHSPSERIDIKTVGKFWKHLVDILESIH